MPDQTNTDQANTQIDQMEARADQMEARADQMDARARFPHRFTGRTVLVTGAGTGFGAEIAVRAAQEGARVVVHYNRSREGAEQTAKRIEQTGSEAALVQADITSWDEIRALADAAFGAFGHLDVAVNNVGDVARDQMSWRDITEESIDHVLAVDIKGTLLCTQEFGSRMLDQGGGCIINIGSTVIVRGSARAPQYAAAKYGILGITKSYAAAFAPTVRVNTFAPGFIETQATLNRKDWKSGRGDTLRSLTPMGRIPKPEEVAGTALFLATEDASHMTGGYMVADGGYNMVGA
jgi:3-oxoacyl-[acyl-carrier protein] reductase